MYLADKAAAMKKSAEMDPFDALTAPDPTWMRMDTSSIVGWWARLAGRGASSALDAGEYASPSRRAWFRLGVDARPRIDSRLPRSSKNKKPGGSAYL